MRQSHRGIRGVHRLPTRPAGAIHIDAHIVGVDLDVAGFLGFGHHQNPGGGSVDTPLRFGHRHELHAMHPTLVLQVRPHAFLGGGIPLRLDGDLCVLHPAQVRLGQPQHLEFPTLSLGVTLVHPQQIPGK